jgi:hypothetical protein
LRDELKQAASLLLNEAGGIGYLKQQISVCLGTLRYLCDGEVPYVCMESGPETEKTKQITKLTLAITLLIRFIPTTYPLVI